LFYGKIHSENWSRLKTFPAGGQTLWLDPKSMQKDQDCFDSSHHIFTKPNFGRV